MAVIANFTAGKVIGKPLTKERGIGRANLCGLLPCQIDIIPEIWGNPC
jgi:hypothetical protein